MILSLDIDCSKIEKARLAKGKYLKADCVEQKPEKKQRWPEGNIKYDGFIAQKVSKEEREQGVRGPIIGNFRIVKADNSESNPLA